MTPAGAEAGVHAWPYTAAARANLVGEAAVSLRSAARHCRGCRWYHGAWTTWRALGLVSGADVHREFYRRALPPLPPRPRVLISGTADAALLAVVADALGDRAPAARLHVLDRCRTPLLACRRFAAGQGLALDCHVRDILDFVSAAPFDLIVVHAFLGFFAPARRADLMARWFALLAPGGHLMMVQRLRPEHPAGAARFDATQTARFVHDVLRAGDPLGERTPLAADALERLAREYAAHKVTHPVTGVAALCELLASAGLRIEQCQVASAAGGAGGTAAGPTLRNADGYAQLVARRAASA